MKRYDLAVIGGGAGGLVVAAGAAGLGATVALIHKEALGGDCLWSGCVPSKSLLHSARILHIADEAEAFGRFVQKAFDFQEVKRRFREAIRRIEKHDGPERFRALGVDVYEGKGAFLDDHRLSINGEREICAKRIVIATGSRPAIPPIPGLKDSGYLTNESVFELERQPESMVVIGGGAVGLEMAQAFARFGTKITLLEAADDILPHEDRDAVRVIRDQLSNEGIAIHTGARVTEVRSEAGKKTVTGEVNGERKRWQAEEILVAAGRKPNIESLDLEKAGVRSNHAGILVDHALRTSRKHIFAVGDVNGKFPFTHAAGYEGKIAVANALLGLRRKAKYRAFPWVIYTDPEVFHMGLTEEEAKENHRDVRVYVTALRDVDRFITEQDTTGFVKIITDRRGRILGAHAVGTNAGDWMQGIVYAAAYNKRIGTVSQIIHPYPAHSAALQQTADLYWRQRLFSGRISRWIRSYVRRFR